MSVCVSFLCSLGFSCIQHIQSLFTQESCAFGDKAGTLIHLVTAGKQQEKRSSVSGYLRSGRYLKYLR